MDKAEPQYGYPDRESFDHFVYSTVFFNSFQIHDEEGGLLKMVLN
jgi:hypothetical protein